MTSCGDDTSKPGQWKGSKAGARGNKPIKSIPIEVENPEIGLAASYYVTTATIEPNSDAKIIARTSGAVKQILHEEGDDVEVGEVLLVLDDDDQRLRAKQAKQKLSSATREYKRLTKMKKAGVVSPTEWEATENTFKNAETDFELAKLALSYTRVTAPIKGRMVRREVDLGTQVAQGELLARIMSIKPLLVRVHIPANRIGKIAIGQTVRVKLDSIEQPLNSNIELISPIVEPTTGTIKITLRVDDYPANVRPGDFAEIHMITDQHQQALLIPSVSLIEERGQNYLYTVKNGKAHRQAVTVGFVMTDKTEIVTGISANDKIVTKGQRNLNDDDVVEILEANSVALPSNPRNSKLDASTLERGVSDKPLKKPKRGKNRGKRGQK